MSASRGEDGSEQSSEPAGSDAPSSIQPPTVLIADGPNRARRYERWLDDPFPVRCAKSPDEAREETAEDVGVEIIGAGVCDETKSELLDLLAVRSPFARTIVIQGDDQPPMLDGSGYDVCLFTPVEEADLREAVERLARIATYERAVSTFFEYTTYAANRKVGRDEEEVLEDETYLELQDRIDRTQATLERIRAAMDDADRRILLESIEADPGAGFDQPQGEGGRHPDNCYECDLEWGVHHGDGLGNGYDQLGAFVWKCARCGNVQQAASASHRWLARR